MKYPNLWHLPVLISEVEKRETEIQSPYGNWHPARPLGYPSFFRRCKIAWLVFTGKADAVTWPGGQ